MKNDHIRRCDLILDRISEVDTKKALISVLKLLISAILFHEVKAEIPLHKKDRYWLLPVA